MSAVAVFPPAENDPGRPAHQLDLQTFMERVVELQTMPYNDYLQTPEWKELRRRALARAGNRCQLNAHHWRGLHVHHRTYARRGVERLEDLTVLCAGCHRHVHDYMSGEAPDAA